MTSAEMLKEFDILYDKITSFSAPGYEDDEKSIFLTKAQERVVLSLLNPLKNFVHEGFEETEVRRKDLQELVKGATLITPSATQTNVYPNGIFFDLPEDCLYVISEEITTSSSIPCKNNVRVRVKPITHDYYTINKENPWKKPNYLQNVWRLDYSSRKHEIITDGTFTVSSYVIRYIKKLQPIIIGANTVDGATGPLNCELNPIIHKRIVEVAVQIATGVTTPELYQIKTIEQKQGEN